ncbi:uncharacterized protein LOC106640327 [Copidosoma floridanum]|uniref:uncharacterized protein LOC106640327 n=1 Tax=Copidosoma floridanum TaxID=29053 RepID=UPI000C6F730F|nr:uncharacterized protein LOC106640327 [Copidosoma floridanum]
MKTAILAVMMLGLAVAQDVYRGRPFQNPSQGFHQPRQLPQHQQKSQQQTDSSNENSQYQEAPAASAGHVDDRRAKTTPIPILVWNKQQEHDGTYRTNYETGNNIIAEESGYIKTVGEGEDQTEALVQEGSYSYTSPEGQIITIRYMADETGFHATGDHLPTSPPVSAEIQKGLDLIYAGIRQQQEADAREAALKNNNQPLNQQIDRRGDADKFRP